MEDPEAFARPDVEAADVALHIRFAFGNAAGFVRGADDHDVLGDDGSCMQSDFAVDQIDFLIVILLQIDDAILSEGRYRCAGLGVERDETVSGRDVENSLLSSVGPVSQAAPG